MPCLFLNITLLFFTTKFPAKIFFQLAFFLFISRHYTHFFRCIHSICKMWPFAVGILQGLLFISITVLVLAGCCGCCRKESRVPQSKSKSSSANTSVVSKTISRSTSDKTRTKKNDNSESKSNSLESDREPPVRTTRKCKKGYANDSRPAKTSNAKKKKDATRKEKDATRKKKDAPKKKKRTVREQGMTCLDTNVDDVYRKGLEVSSIF